MSIPLQNPNSKTPRLLLWLGAVALVFGLGFLARVATPQDAASSADERLQRSRYRSGEQTLKAFAPISAATRQSIVKLNVNGKTVALGTVVDTNGLALTKASELETGTLTCWLASEKEVAAEVLGVDEEQDLALVKVHTSGLKPIAWASGTVAVGQWALTPGIAATPQAVGIVSALPRRIRPQRAFIGVQFDFRTSAATIEDLIPGLGAEQAGLKAGDTIVGLNDLTVTNREQVSESLRDFREGQTVKLRVLRNQEEFDAQIRMMPPTTAQLRGAQDSDSPYRRLTGDVSHRAQDFQQVIEHDTVLQPWLCGGPLVNLDGKAIGLNIARAGRVSTYALPAEVVKRALAQLRSTPKRAPATPAVLTPTAE